MHYFKAPQCTYLARHRCSIVFHHVHLGWGILFWRCWKKKRCFRISFVSLSVLPMGIRGGRKEERRRGAVNSLTNRQDGRTHTHTALTMSTHTHTHTHKAAHTAINRFLKSITVNKAAKWSETPSRRPNSLLSFESKNLDGQLYLMWHITVCARRQLQNEPNSEQQKNVPGGECRQMCGQRDGRTDKWAD